MINFFLCTFKKNKKKNKMKPNVSFQLWKVKCQILRFETFMLTIIKLTTKYEALQEQFTQTNGT